MYTEFSSDRSVINRGVAIICLSIPSHLHELDINHTALRLATGVFQISPFISLLYESEEWSLRQHTQEVINIEPPRSLRLFTKYSRLLITINKTQITKKIPIFWNQQILHS